jgi:polar amino acid transport system permease protein
MSVFFHQFFDVNFMLEHFGEVLEGFWLTIQIWFVAAILALIWGLILALMRQAPGKKLLPVRFVSIAYIDIFRAIPALLLIVLIATGIPSLTFLPKDLRIPEWLGKPDPFWYGTLALMLTYGAYMAEVYRAGIEAVPKGQMEASRSLGMSYRQTMRSVIVPQAVTKIPAPMLNELISLMKDTTLVSVIALNEVLQRASDIQSSTYNSSALTLGAIFFLVIILPLARLTDRLIKRNQSKIARGAHIEVA